ncbi:cytoplasmic dynein 2 heavy chain 1-like protein [Labeo rohita]|uniref:Cytoplasmic dynein 2 heavy chain 1-like protein n=1 Tax=Labeo rohita TaxID=84645 RepID=A0A498M8T7_LABRO|nr:cytoplasmic dynein 2 heavy chain 1-like protein [Labeo rohita]
METTVRNTDHAITFLNEPVEKLLKDTTSHNERISALEKKTLDLREENKQLKLQLLEANSYRQKWGLRLQGMKEEDPQENTRDLVIKVLGKISPKIAEKLPEVVDSVHRIGKRKDGNSARGIIIQFSMCHFRDFVWRDARGLKFLEDAHLRLKEDL